MRFSELSQNCEAMTDSVPKNARWNKKLVKVRKNQKADWRAVDYHKKRTDKFDLFAVKSKETNKKKSSVLFLGESAFEIN